MHIERCIQELVPDINIHTTYIFLDSIHTKNEQRIREKELHMHMHGSYFIAMRFAGIVAFMTGTTAVLSQACFMYDTPFGKEQKRI